MHANGLDTIFLVAPTSTNARIEKIAHASSGFLYLISRAGVTGAREALPPELPGLARRFENSRRFRLLWVSGFRCRRTLRCWAGLPMPPWSDRRSWPKLRRLHRLRLLRKLWRSEFAC